MNILDIQDFLARIREWFGPDEVREINYLNLRGHTVLVVELESLPSTQPLFYCQTATYGEVLQMWTTQRLENQFWDLRN